MGQNIPSHNQCTILRSLLSWWMSRVCGKVHSRTRDIWGDPAFKASKNMWFLKFFEIHAYTVHAICLKSVPRESTHSSEFWFRPQISRHIRNKKDDLPSLFETPNMKSRITLHVLVRFWSSFHQSNGILILKKMVVVLSSWEISELANKHFFASLCVRSNLASAAFEFEATPLTDRD